MKQYLLFLGVLFLCCGCRTDSEQIPEPPLSPMTFDPVNWQMKDGRDYPYRASMLDDVVYNDTIRSLDETALLSLLGDPDRRNEDYLYYLVSQKRLFTWPLHTRTMVVKLSADTIEWIKIHE